MLKYLFFLVITPSIADAYIGPGMAGGVLVAILGIIAALVIGLIGIIWLPIKTLIQKNKKKPKKIKLKIKD